MKKRRKVREPDVTEEPYERPHLPNSRLLVKQNSRYEWFVFLFATPLLIILLGSMAIGGSDWIEAAAPVLMLGLGLCAILTLFTYSRRAKQNQREAGEHSREALRATRPLAILTRTLTWLVILGVIVAIARMAWLAG